MFLLALPTISPDAVLVMSLPSTVIVPSFCIVIEALPTVSVMDSPAVIVMALVTLID